MIVCDTASFNGCPSTTELPINRGNGVFNIVSNDLSVKCVILQTGVSMNTDKISLISQPAQLQPRPPIKLVST